MTLITILLCAVAVLTFLTGVAVLCGVTKQSRASGVWFFLSTLGAAVWTAAIALFFTMPEAWSEYMPWTIIGTIVGITLTDVALIGYTSWGNGLKGKVTTAVFAILGAGVDAMLIVEPELLYTGVTYGTNYNTLHTVHGWYFYLLIVFFFLISIAYSGALAEMTKKVKGRGAKNGLKIFRAGLSVGGILALVFNLLLMTSKPDLIWIGPMAVSISIIAFYYSVVRYRILALSGQWMEILSYVIMIVTGVVLYTLVFYLVFMAIFKVPTPSVGILTLNFIMVAVVMCMIPALQEVTSLIRSLLPTKQVDVGYATRKLNQIAASGVDLKELAGFLAMVLKVNYVGFLINGRTYESQPLRLPVDDLAAIEKLPLPKEGMWQKVKGATKGEAVERVAMMYNKKGQAFGQVMLGKQAAGQVLDAKDLAQIEMILKLTGIIIDEDPKIKTK